MLILGLKRVKVQGIIRKINYLVMPEDVVVDVLCSGIKTVAGAKA